MYVRPLPRALLLVFLASGFTRSAFALADSDKEAVRQLSNDAAADYNAGKLEAARDKFTRAYALAKVPKLAVWVARTQVRLGKLVSAYEFYRQAVRLERNELWVGDAQELAQKDAARELATLQNRLAKVTIVVEGVPAEDVEVSIDGNVVPSALLGVERYVDPGRREITATRGPLKHHEMVTLPEGEERNVVLRFDPAVLAALPASTPVKPATSSTVVVAAVPTQSPESKPKLGSPSQGSSGSAQRTWGWVGVGVGAAGLLTGTVSGLIVAAKYSDLKKDCPGGVCDASDSGRVDSYRSMRTLSLVGFIVGGVGAVTGVTLLLTSPKPVEKVAGVSGVGVWVTPATVGLSGKF